MNAPAGSPGLILVALALVMTTWTLVPLARARRLVRSASAASLTLLAAGLIALGVWGGRIAARLAQLPVDAPVRGHRQDPEPPGPGPCSIPSSIPSVHSGGEDRLPLAGPAAAAPAAPPAAAASPAAAAPPVAPAAAPSNGSGSGSGTSNGSGSGTTDSQGSNPKPTAPQPVQSPSTPSTPPSTSQGQGTTPTTEAPTDSPGNVPSGSGGPGQLP